MNKVNETMKSNKFAVSLIAIFAAATLSACATSGTVPNKFAANETDSPAQSFCKAEAVKIAQKVGIRQMGGNPLSGHSDMQEVREHVLADCLRQVASR
jgi:hypothetical protein